MSYTYDILILTPVKDAERFLDMYFRLLYRLTYLHHLISPGLLEGDSSDETYRLACDGLPELQQTFRRAQLWKKDFGFTIPTELPRWSPQVQIQRRAIIAKSRNHLLFHALNDEDWVLWIDVDVIDYPPDIIERLLATGKEIVEPNCVKEYGGLSFDLDV